MHVLMELYFVHVKIQECLPETSIPDRSKFLFSHAMHIPIIYLNYQQISGRYPRAKPTFSEDEEFVSATRSK